ncbi:MAG: pyruvate dehydrogenase complex dihydrolipoamide acetyltransferase [Pseudomonadota bacterium]
MATEILMPALSPTMEEGKLAKWLVKEGDEVSSGDVIAEIETDKATMEVEAIDDGKIGKIVISDGTDSVKVGTQIAILLEEGEDASAIETIISSGGTTEVPSAANAPAAASEAATASAPVTAAAVSSAQPQDRVKASPLARRLASQNNIDISQISGSGPYGRIVKADITHAIENGVPSQQSAQQTKPSSSSAAPALPQGMKESEILALYNQDDYEVSPVDGMRKVIAKRLLESKTTIPHFYLNADVQLDALLELRKTINARSPAEGPNSYKVSVNDFIIKALALALQHIPDANVTWTGDAILKHKYSDVGVAVSVEGGLFTPVIRRAESKGLVAISNEMKDLAKRARARKLAPHEYQGGTTAVSNLGMFGVKNFNAIINPPHASILAVGAGTQQPLVKEGALSVGTIMTATLSIDHRAVDGALGAELLKAFKDLIEDPMGLLL